MTFAGLSDGCWRCGTDQVARYRRAVADPVQGPRLEREVSRQLTAAAPSEASG